MPLRKVGEVVGHDDPGLATDRCSEHVSIVRVWQLQCADEPLVSSHEAIRHGQVHQFPCATQLLRLQVGAPFENRSHPLGVNLFGPARTEKIRQSDAQQQIPERRRMEYAGIVDSSETCHALVSQPQFLGLRSELVESFLALHARTLQVFDQILEENAPVGAYLSIGQFAALKQAHQMRPGYVEKIGRLLSRKLGVVWHDSHGVALRHLGEDVD